MSTDDILQGIEGMFWPLLLRCTYISWNGIIKVKGGFGIEVEAAFTSLRLREGVNFEKVASVFPTIYNENAKEFSFDPLHLPLFLNKFLALNRFNFLVYEVNGSTLITTTRLEPKLYTKIKSKHSWHCYSVTKKSFSKLEK